MCAKEKKKGVQLKRAVAYSLYQVNGQFIAMIEVGAFALFTLSSRENAESAGLYSNVKREALFFYECFRKKKNLCF